MHTAEKSIKSLEDHIEQIFNIEKERKVVEFIKEKLRNMKDRDIYSTIWKIEVSEREYFIMMMRKYLK